MSPAEFETASRQSDLLTTPYDRTPLDFAPFPQPEVLYTDTIWVCNRRSVSGDPFCLKSITIEAAIETPTLLESLSAVACLQGG
jgi:hypothetical protein